MIGRRTAARPRPGILGGQQENKTFPEVLLGTRMLFDGGATLSAASASLREGLRNYTSNHGGSRREKRGGYYSGNHFQRAFFVTIRKKRQLKLRG